MSDLTTRFQGLKGAHKRGYTADALKKDDTPLDIPELQNENNNKTVEELLAELGPDDTWTFGKDEDIEINTLLKNAHGALSNGAAKEEDTTPATSAHQDTDTAQTDVISISVERPISPPEPDSDISSPASPSSEPKLIDLDTEAELTLRRLLDEIALDPSPSMVLSQAADDDDPPPPYHGRGSPLNDAVDDALARRFVNLSVPQTRTSTHLLSDDEGDDGLNLPSVPTTIRKPGSSVKAAAAAPTDETETWCIICFVDAQVKCLGCDGDLYCTKCWMEGHRGEDAGFEEKRHRAVAFVNGGELKKARRLVGA